MNPRGQILLLLKTALVQIGCCSINSAARNRFEDYQQGTMIAQSCSKNVWDWERHFSILCAFYERR